MQRPLPPLFILLAIVATVCLSAGCESSYTEHFYAEHPPESSQEASLQSLEASGTTLTGIFLSFPSADSQEFLTDLLKNETETMWIETYLWTNVPFLFDAVLQAQRQGADVQVLLEANVYKNFGANSATSKKLKKQNIPVSFADNERYRFTHAKFWTISSGYCISTGNWTRSFFSKNKEYIYCGEDDTTLEALKKIFQADQKKMPFQNEALLPPHLVVSPLNSREKFDDFFNLTQASLSIYVQTLTDTNILQTLGALQKKGKNIYICTAENESNREAQKKYTNFTWKFQKKPYLHAKAMIMDEKNIFIGSHNLTANALNNNREIGIILFDRLDIGEKIAKDIETNCQ